ncbi:ectopic P granules protein 5 homolog [Hydra vulgaris]|uniref:ectopic P granules protein 5 homolog n=1 Tax=Hydra vulgaris TaxID=6087 RepID=UPI0032EA63CF
MLVVLDILKSYGSILWLVTTVKHLYHWSHRIFLNQETISYAHLAIKFWMHMFTRLPFWHRDYSVLFQIDNLCKVAFSVHDGLSKVQDMLFNEYKELIKLNEPRGILSSVMSWMSSNQLISFMPSVTTNFCYFAYVVLVVEQRYEKSIDFWKMISLEMLMNLSVTAEQAYKRISTASTSSTGTITSLASRVASVRGRGRIIRATRGRIGTGWLGSTSRALLPASAVPEDLIAQVNIYFT